MDKHKEVKLPKNWGKMSWEIKENAIPSEKDSIKEFQKTLKWAKKELSEWSKFVKVVEKKIAKLRSK